MKQSGQPTIDVSLAKSANQTVNTSIDAPALQMEGSGICITSHIEEFAITFILI